MQYRKSSYAEGVFDTYWFEKNLQGDIIAVYSETGTKLISYTYDAWGNSTVTYHNGGASTTATFNPFRYRGYYFDKEIGFYYLNSRYYDPVVGRFVNADVFLSTGQGLLGNNMFAYCNNNPVNMYDPTGTLAFPGEIHNQVVEHLAYLYTLASEEWILYIPDEDNKFYGLGRADLISWDGQVWDVKRDKPRQIEKGKKQVEKYADNIWINFSWIDLSVGGNQIESGFFYYKSGLINYKVTYRNAGNGVIAYDYRITEFKTSSQGASVALATIAIAGMFMVNRLPRATVSASFPCT